MRRIFSLLWPLLGKWRFAFNIGLGIVSGLCSFLFINVVTRVISLLMAGHFTKISREYLLLFAAIILLYIWTKRSLALTIIDVSQKMFWQLRKQILSLVLKANYQQLAGRKMNVHAAIVNDVNTLTQTSLTIIDFFTSLILSLACLVYLATISLPLFFMTLGVALVGMVMYQLGTRRNIRQFEQARKLENNFLKHFNAILDGFKEISLEPAKGWALFNRRIVTVSEEVYHNNTKAFTGFVNNQMTGQILFYALISVILLVCSIVLQIKAEDVVRFIFTLLYLLGAIEMVMALLPGLARARVAADHLAGLTTELEEAELDSRLPAHYYAKDEFQSLATLQLAFSYPGEESAFHIGPVDFRADKGELIFLYGGNGSGKTTFVHALLGLQTPTGGEIRFNDQRIAPENYPEYRTLFAVVFSDFYLFDELLSTVAVHTDQWNYYLRLFELEDKVTLDGLKFSTVSLSTGQRKRLALIAALMEKKPVLVIDEWAADQDPYFRRKFYTEILPLLKQEGITVIAVTHDDRYYHCADKLYKMDNGKLYREDTQLHAAGFVPN